MCAYNQIFMKDLLFKSEFYEDINYTRFFAGLVLLIGLVLLFQLFYSKFSNSPTNRKSFASTFVLFAVSIFLIVTTIKSSLALSLGMVGALSIIRFRTAIKEPEQLVYFLGVTGIAIAIAAEKEILALIITFAFGSIAFIKSILNKKNNSSKDIKHVILSLKTPNSFEDVNLILALSKIDGDNDLVCKNFYEDNEGNIRITYSTENSTKFDVNQLKGKLKSLDIKQFTIKMID